MKIAGLIYLSVFVNYAVFAADISVVGVKQTTIPIAAKTDSQKRLSKTLASTSLTHSAYKPISLLHLQLSDKAAQTFKARAAKWRDASPSSSLQATLPASVQLNMNGVPVLDQGVHGSCVTFAQTAAIDAAMGQGDYISQLCQLQLGKYLARSGYHPSGWDGSFAPNVLGQISLFGIVSKAAQKKSGCGGATVYPTLDKAPDTDMSPDEFHALSESIDTKVGWTSLLDILELALDEADTEKTLQAVKQSLSQGDRVTFGVLLISIRQGVAGAIGRHHARYDTWLLTPEIADDLDKGRFDFGGHEMVITGFDDNALAEDDEGRIYHGLLTLRNSWGDDVGHHGEFYMSYDYFKTLVLEANRIRSFIG